MLTFPQAATHVYEDSSQSAAVAGNHSRKAQFGNLPKLQRPQNQAFILKYPQICAHMRKIRYGHIFHTISIIVNPWTKH